MVKRRPKQPDLRADFHRMLDEALDAAPHGAPWLPFFIAAIEASTLKGLFANIKSRQRAEEKVRQLEEKFKVPEKQRYRPLSLEEENLWRYP